VARVVRGERPVIFTGESVRAILAGRKTQTRRVAKHRHGIGFLGGLGEENDPECWGYAFDGPDHHGYMVLARGKDERHDHGCISIPCPYGERGTKLWVREAFALSVRDPELHEHDVSDRSQWDGAVYRADGETGDWESYDGDGNRSRIAAPWRSPLFMPRWASRITLEVTSVRVERLQDITEDDALAEGIQQTHAVNAGDGMAVQNYAMLWDRLNHKRARWASNPWLWCLTFKVVKA
jgi:hypothetical protein